MAGYVQDFRKPEMWITLWRAVVKEAKAKVAL
jgi:hypothetical protein